MTVIIHVNCYLMVAANIVSGFLQYIGIRTKVVFMQNIISIYSNSLF